MQSVKAVALQLFGTRTFTWANFRDTTPLLDRAVAAVFTWALAKPAVQRAVADAFTTRSTPMCDALQSAIESNLDRVEVDADNVTGLERAIKSAMESAFEAMDARDIKYFDAAVARVVNGMDTDDITDNVVESLIERLRK